MDSTLISQLPGMMEPPPASPGMGGSTPLPAGLSNLADPLVLTQGLPEMPLPFRPKYRSWYKPSPKPSVQKILTKARQKDWKFLERNLAIAETIAALRLHTSGAFKEDVVARELGQKEGYVSTSLLDEWNVLWALIAGIDHVYNKEIRHPDQAMKSQVMEDVAYDMRDKAKRQWVRRGDMPLPIAESKVMTAYGFLVSRCTIDMYDADYPFDHCLIDPATVFPEYEGKRGLKCVLRIFKAKLYDIVYDFYSGDDELPPELRKRLKKLENGDIDDTDDEEIEIVEYWDRTWCAVIAMDGTVIKPVYRHDYGVVPYVIGYGPGGEPMFTSPQDYYNKRDSNGRIQPYATHGQAHSRYKATSAIRNGMVRNAQEEALASLIVEEIRKAANPPVVWKRSMMAAHNKHKVVIDGRRGGLTELFAGEEELEPFPTAPNPGLLQMMLQFMGKNSQSNSIPMSLLGQINQSNVSGTAVSSAADSGMDKIAPWIQSMESFAEQEFELKMELWRNAGHLTRFMEESPSPLLVPDRRVKHAVHELTTELLDEMGYSITCKMTKVRNGELLPLGNALKLINEAGFMSKRTASEYLGVTDFDREQELWRDERSVDLAFQEPDFLKVFTIPLAIEAQIKALEGFPEQQALMMVLRDEWMELMAAPKRQEIMAAGQQAMMGAQPGAPGQMPPGPGTPPGIVNPNTAAGVSFSGPMAQGPGSQTGIQGGQPPSGEGNPMAGGPGGF